METAESLEKDVARALFRTSIALLAMLLFALVCRNAFAVVLADGDVMVNTSAAADDPGGLPAGAGDARERSGQRRARALRSRHLVESQHDRSALLRHLQSLRALNHVRHPAVDRGRSQHLARP